MPKGAMRMRRDLFVANGAVRLHAILWGTVEPGQTPLVVSPGFWEPAEMAEDLFAHLGRPGVSVSYRGRGRSDTPEHGYDLGDHVGDLECVVDAAVPGSFCLLGYSRGGAYALEYALRHSDRIAGLVLVDQPPFHTVWPKGSAAPRSAMTHRGEPILNFFRLRVAHSFEESTHRDFTPDLGRIACPVLVLRGTRTDVPIPAKVDGRMAALYESALPRVAVVSFAASGHQIPLDEPERYAAVVGAFLARFDDQRRRALVSDGGGGLLRCRRKSVFRLPGPSPT